jgi:hypothetical protein
MKGILKKTEQGWFVIYDQILGEGIVKRNQNALPLHPLDVKQIDEDSKVFDNIEARIKAYPDVEFEIETELVFDRLSYSSIEVPKYAKLINKEDIKPKQCNTWDDIFDKIESEMDCVVPLKVVNYLEKYYKKPELLFSQTDEKGKEKFTISDEVLFEQATVAMESHYGYGCETEIDAYFRGAKWMLKQFENK